MNGARLFGEFIGPLVGPVEFLISAFLLFVLFLVLRDVCDYLAQQRAIPLPQRNMRRATRGAFLITFTIVLMLSTQPHHPYDVVGFVIGAIALLYFLVGVRGCRGMQVDIMSAVFWSGGAGLAGWLLITGMLPPRITWYIYFIEACLPFAAAFFDRAVPFVHPVLAALCLSAVAACAARVVLMLWPAPGAKLPPPSKVPGMPIAGPASPAAVHAALGGRRRGFFHRLFRT